MFRAGNAAALRWLRHRLLLPPAPAGTVGWLPALDNVCTELRVFQFWPLQLWAALQLQPLQPQSLQLQPLQEATVEKERGGRGRLSAAGEQGGGEGGAAEWDARGPGPCAGAGACRPPCSYALARYGE